MRMSCNGCRVLRRGCSGVDCVLGACLQWIKTPDSQANATLFLAKFYGRAGLFNLINVGPTHLRPQIFRSLLYEACGRITNPVHGVLGLLCSGEWARCRDAVDAVLDGKPLVKQAHHGCDIRHRTGTHKRVKNWVEPDARFTITGWAGEIEMETVRPSLVNLPEHDFQGVESGSWPSEIGLELTLGGIQSADISDENDFYEFFKSSGTLANL